MFFMCRRENIYYDIANKVPYTFVVFRYTLWLSLMSFDNECMWRTKDIYIIYGDECYISKRKLIFFFKKFFLILTHEDMFLLPLEREEKRGEERTPVQE